MDHFESSIVGTAIQFSGTVLVAILCAILLRTVRRPFLQYWAAGWSALSCALAALLAGFAVGRCDPAWRAWQWSFFAVYCLCEYTAGYLWIAGCRNLTVQFRLSRRDAVWALPAVVIAAPLPWLTSRFTGQFDSLMIVHSLIMAGFFAAAFALLYVGRPRTNRGGAGIGVMMAALFILSVDFLQYAPLCGYSQWTGQRELFPHLKYSSLYDLMLEMLLAFGMVMVVMESVRQELEDANRELRSAGSRLKRLAQSDPLTGALNRHAFDALLGEAREDKSQFRGCVAILDLDRLKAINDTLGHHAGDRAIQLVAQAARSLIRPDDLLFRWGGDEFLILWLGTLKESDAALRLECLNDVAAKSVQNESTDARFDASVSWGLSSFTDVNGVEAAIQIADYQMYERKSARRAERAPMTPSFP